MSRLVRRNKIKVKSDMLLVEKIAKVRGIDNIDNWMNPPSTYVHSPYRIENIDKAVEEIVKAIHKQLNIVIVADIDTDGVCSTALMNNYLLELTPNVRYIHAQRSDGHGVETVLDQISDDIGLLIIVDSSSNSVKECKEISEKGIPIIIIDHHNISVENPFALIVNCQMGEYPNKNLSGSAMCYKVCQVIDEYLGLDLSEEFQDLSAIGIVADMMSVKNMENRYLIYNGINNISNLGIREILRQSKIDYNDGISTTDIGFKIAPIIGACSRFDKIELALELLTCVEAERAIELVKEMIEMNELRKVNQKVYVENAIKKIDSSNNIIIYVDNEIDSGFRGLIATEFVERFQKPVFVLTHFVSEDGVGNKYMGSARSIGSIPLQSLCSNSNLFHFAEGHEGAFGVSFSEDDLNEIISYFNETLDSTDLQKEIIYDLELDVKDLDELDIVQVEKFARISGQGFPEPKFLIKGFVAEEGHTKKLGNHVRAVMGANEDTVKINCEDGFALMKFRTQSTYAKEIEEHFYNEDNFATEINAVGSLNLNKFYNGGLKRWVVTKQVFLEYWEIVE